MILKKEKRQLEELAEGNLNNKTIFNLQSNDISKIILPFINYDKSNFSQNSQYEELVKNIKKNFEQIKLKVIKNSKIAIINSYLIFNIQLFFFLLINKFFIFYMYIS